MLSPRLSKRILIPGLLLALATSALAADTMTLENGAPVVDNQRSQAVGAGGPLLIQDAHLLEKLAHFDRERIPERVVHARGAGAFGEFVASKDFSDVTQASIFSQKGKKTPMFVRFSLVIPSSGAPETLRDPRGFAIKFYTDQGNWDLVGNDIDVFFIRDTMKFPDMIHAFKPSPITNQQDPNRIFDFFQHLPESTHMLSKLYSDLGIPADYRHMDGSSVNAFKLVNAKGEVSYVKFSWKTKQGLKFLDTPEKVAAVQGTQQPGHATRDLYEAIGRGELPSWEFRAQVIPEAKVNSFKFNPLDATKSWPENEIPPVVLGAFTLKKVPDNFFQFTEQSAFDPGVLVPGIEPSEDRLLQGRLFSYGDTQRYRIGVNYQQLPVNAPRADVHTHNQDGRMSFMPKKSDVNYEPSAKEELPQAKRVTAGASSPLVHESAKKLEDFYQAGEFFRSLPKDAQQRLINNISADLKTVKSAATRNKVIEHLRQADKDYGDRVAAMVGKSG